MSQERRLQLVTQCKGFAEEAKIRIRNARRDANKLVDTEEKAKLINETRQARKEQVQEMTRPTKGQVAT